LNLLARHKRRGWLAGVYPAALGVWLAVLAGGCGTVGVSRNYEHISYRPTEHFRVQFLLPEGTVDRPVPIDNLLILQPVGRMTDDQSRLLLLAIWQELQQNLPGIVRTPEIDGLFAPYTSADNLMRDDGRIDEAELERIGRLAGASHLLIARVINYRPYPPQSIIMEWILLDVAQKRKVLILAGAMDASEQKVRNAAVNYTYNRRSEPNAAGNVEVILRSPREYSRFAVAQAVDSLKGWLRPESEVFVPYLSY
jgi:hypothetical protein